MNSHPTIVHAAADFHRLALLSEAVDDGRTNPSSVRMTSTGPGRAYRRTVTWLAKVLSQIIDDFEPGLGAPPRRSVGGALGKPYRDGLEDNRVARHTILV